MEGRVSSSVHHIRQLESGCEHMKFLSVCSWHYFATWEMAIKYKEKNAVFPLTMLKRT